MNDQLAIRPQVLEETSQQRLPVAIKRLEMAAEIFPYFQHDTLPDFGRENLWFLQIIPHFLLLQKIFPKKTCVVK